ncbi:MAG: LysM peptidoglycan-binding domain-containing protein [Vicingaceae bacterium]
MKRILLSIGFLFCFSLFSFAQEAEVAPDLKVHQIKGNKYYIHVVEKGNTLYSISRMYAVEVEVLKEENPRLTKELTIGDRLLIPLKEVKRKNLEETVDVDGNYLIHEVQRKNTLYSIAKEYNVEISDILAENPDAEKLKKGMKLKIPVAKIKSTEQDTAYIAPAAASPYVTHRVAPKETLYSLSKLYEVTIDSLMSVNNGLPGGLKVDQLINIPILKTYEDTTIEKAVFDSTAVKTEYRVVLLLPFYLDLLEKAQDTSYSRSEELTKDLFSKAKYGIEFLKGFQMAVDSMRNSGMNLTLHVFDTGHDTAKVRQLLKDSALHQADLIVGPLYLDEFMMVADFAKRNHINIVSPVKQSNKILLGNNYVSKVITSDPIMTRFMGQYLADSLSKEKLFILYPDHFKERRAVSSLKQSYLQQMEQKQDSGLLNLPQEIRWDVKRFAEFKAKWDTAKLNVLVIPSEEQAFVTQLMTMLNLEDDYDFLLLGPDSWQNFDNIDVEYMHKLNVHLVSSTYINHEEKEVKAFDQKFIRQNDLMPEKYSYLGFDVGLYYLSLMNQFGLNFEVMFLGYQAEFLAHKFEFFKTGIESGYENRSVFLLKYEDYQLKRVY